MPALRDALRDLTEDVFFDLLESEEAYLLVLDVPGITAESLDCTIEEGQVTITAQREKAVPEGYQYLEENRSLFLDVELPLPDDVRTTGIETDAVVERGVLEVTLPKETAEETTIDIVDRRSDERDGADPAVETEAGGTPDGEAESSGTPDEDTGAGGTPDGDAATGETPDAETEADRTDELDDEPR